MQLLLLILPTFALGFIEIKITGILNSNLWYQKSGLNSAVISPKEKQVFGLNDDAIKDAIKQTFGARPDNVYVRSPTPFGDLYKTNKWKQVTRTTNTVGLKIMNSKRELHVKYKSFYNHGTRDEEVDVSVSMTVNDTISIHWHKVDEETKEKLRMKFEIIAGGNKKKRTHAFKWGQEENVRKSVTFGSASDLNITLHAGELVTSQLEVTKATLVFGFDHESTLSGSVAANYDTEYKGGHFKNFDIGDILSVKNLPKQVQSSTTLEYSFYYDAKIVVTSKDLGNTITEKSLSHSEEEEETSEDNMEENEDAIEEGNKIALSFPKDNEISNTV